MQGGLAHPGALQGARREEGAHSRPFVLGLNLTGSIEVQQNSCRVGKPRTAIRREPGLLHASDAEQLAAANIV